MRRTSDKWTAKRVRAEVAKYLRYNRQCPVIAFERGLSYSSNPDVFAITKKQTTVEVEVKISVSDFQNDKKKYKWKLNSPYHLERQPTFFYYAIPFELLEKVEEEVPEDAGLMVVHRYPYRYEVNVAKTAKRNKHSKVTAKEVSCIVKHQAGTLCTLADAQARHAEES